MKYNTNNPVPSVDVRDLYDNAQNLDNLVNGAAPAYPDRLGVSRKSYKGMELDFAAFLAASGFELPPLTYVDGTTLVVDRPTQLILRDGILYGVKATESFPAALTGTFATDQARLVVRTDSALRQELASASDPAKGAGLIGYDPASPYEDGTVGAALRSSPAVERPEAYGYLHSAPLEARTAAVQAAFDAANTRKSTLLLSAVYSVDTIILEDHREYFITGTGVLLGAATNPRQAVLEIKNSTGLKSSGNITISANENPNYSAAIKVWASGSLGGSLRTCSLHVLDFNVVGCAVGWLFGDLSSPDNLLSEIVIKGGYTYNTPEPVLVIGTQAVIEFNGYQLVSAGSGTLSGVFHSIATVIGGKLHINGGECMLPGVSNGFSFISRPISSPGFENSYGRIFVNGAAVEAASLIYLAYNPSGITDVAPGTGCIRFSQCSGFHSFTGESFQAVADFSGHIVVDSSNSFYAPALRTAKTVGAFGPASVDISDSAFNDNFLRGLNAIRGGVAKFDFRALAQVSDLAGQAIPAASHTVLKFNAASEGELSYFSSNYSASTGLFTVPVGGLKDVLVNISFVLPAAIPNAEIYVLIDGGDKIAGVFGADNKFINKTVFVGSLAAGQTISARFYNPGAAFNFGSRHYDYITFSGRRQ